MATAQTIPALHRDTEKIVNEFIDQLVGVLLKGEKVQIRGLGTWHIKSRKSRTGRNPRTGEAIEIPSHRVVKFKPSFKLINKLNAG